MVGTWAPDASEPQKLRKEDTNGQTFLPSFLLRELQCWEQVKLNCQIIWSREIRIEGSTAMSLHCWDFFFQDNHQIAILLIIYLCHSIPRLIFILFCKTIPKASFPQDAFTGLLLMTSEVPGRRKKYPFWPSKQRKVFWGSYQVI